MLSKKIFICEDHTIVLDGLTLLLSQYPGFQLIGNANTGVDLLSGLKIEQPDILILDLNLPDIDGLTLLKKIRSTDQNLLIIILTMYNDDYLIEQTKNAGANGYLLKNVGNDELLHVLNTVSKETFYLSDSLKSNSEKKKLFNDQFVNKMKLTEREIEILRLLANGNSSADIAKVLHLSTHTVNTHRKNILRKLDMSSTVELVRFVHDNNLL
jgi:DNA-binding NarL/FixJ family response regulator